ncbi:MAG: GW domain-containing glycosaminoglycan-binding protein [Sporolactobacillus sp.]
MIHKTNLSFKLLAMAAIVLLITSLFSYFPVDAKSIHTYYVHRSSYLYNADKGGSRVGSVPINAKLTTSSKSSSKRYRVTYKGATGYIARANLSSRPITVARYVYSTAYLYSANDSSKQRLQTLSINSRLTTSSDLSSTMYRVNYNGRSGYVYKKNLSAGKRVVTLYLKNRAYIYKNYAHTSRYSGLIPANTKLTTTSRQSNKMFWIHYKKHSGYVYASNFAGARTYQTLSYNNAIPSGSIGYVSDGGNHGIWNQPYGLDGAAQVGNASDYVNVPLSIKQESKVGSTVWVQIASNGKMLGWIHKDIMQPVSPNLSFARVQNVSGAIDNAPNGQAIADLTPYAQLKLKIDALSDDGQWAHIRKFTAGTSLGWVHLSDLAVENATDEEQTALNVSYQANVTDSEAPVFDGAIHFQGYLNQYTNDSGVAVSQERQVGNEEMYHISQQDGRSIGWVRSNAIHLNKPATAASDHVFSMFTDDIFNGSADGGSPDLNAPIGSLDAYSNHMLEVVTQTNDYSFIKYNDWYDTDGNDIDLGWVKSADLSQLPDRTNEFSSLFTAEGGNEQGLAYDSDNGKYYVGYDTGNGNGKIVPYVNSGNGQYRADNDHAVYGAFGHACALSYSPFTGKLYEVSSAGPDPVLYTINPDNMQVINSDTIKGMPYVSMMTVKDKNTLILLTEAGSSDAFSEYTIGGSYTDPAAHKVKDMGVVQGMQYDPSNNKLYFLANNYMSVLDNGYNVQDRFYFSIPSGESAQESEGLTVANGKLTIGFGNHQIFQQSNGGSQK